jgi:hypothetical protein
MRLVIHASPLGSSARSAVTSPPSRIEKDWNSLMETRLGKSEIETLKAGAEDFEQQGVIPPTSAPIAVFYDVPG